MFKVISKVNDFKLNPNTEYDEQLLTAGKEYTVFERVNSYLDSYTKKMETVSIYTMVIDNGKERILSNKDLKEYFTRVV